MLLMLDNYDSFTWNLVHYLRKLGAAVEVVRNDEISVADAMASEAEAVVISPGPGHPDDAGISLELIAACMTAAKPLLGICLGHQAIARHFEGVVERGLPVHGKPHAVSHDGSGLFAGLPSPFRATRYNSLTVAEPLPAPLIANGWAEDGTVMGLRHPGLPVHGVQFHPESIATEHGFALLENFLALLPEHPPQPA